MLVNIKVEKERSEIDLFPPDRLRFQKPLKWARKFEQLTGFESTFLPWQSRLLNHEFVRDASVFHLHNIHGGFISLNVIPRLSHKAPLVWTVQDLWPITGHCYYPQGFDCHKWKEHCYQCPGLQDANYYPLRTDRVSWLWRRKKLLYAASNIVFVANSQWTANQIRQSPLARDKEVVVIHNAIDTRRFRPLDKLTARATFELPDDALVLFFAAAGIANERKGGKYLVEAIRKYSSRVSRQVILLIAGLGKPRETFGHEVRIHHLGHIDDDGILALAYNAADVFLCPSLYETFGNTVVEAMACGVPCVAFDTSGIQDTVKHMETGYLAKLRDADDFAKGLAVVLDDPDTHARMGRRGREVAEEAFSADLCAERHERLYEQVVNQRLRAGK